jgi:hypothetical protein
MNIEKLIARDHKLKEDYLKNEDLTSFQKFKFNIRCWISNKFGFWDIWDIFPYRYQRFYFDKIKPIFKPFHSRIRKVIPRQWSDLTQIIIEVNFEIIKSFYEDEYSKDIVDWNSDEHHIKFSKWLESAYKYITVERPELEKQKDDAYPKTDDFSDWFGEEKTDKNGLVTRTMKTCEERYGKPYEEVYAEVNRLEALIDKKDTKVITDLAKNRNYFWT